MGLWARTWQQDCWLVNLMAPSCYGSARAASRPAWKLISVAVSRSLSPHATHTQVSHVTTRNPHTDESCHHTQPTHRWVLSPYTTHNQVRHVTIHNSHTGETCHTQLTHRWVMSPHATHIQVSHVTARNPHIGESCHYTQPHTHVSHVTTRNPHTGESCHHTQPTHIWVISPYATHAKVRKQDCYSGNTDVFILMRHNVFMCVLDTLKCLYVFRRLWCDHVFKKIVTSSWVSRSHWCLCIYVFIIPCCVYVCL